MPSLLGDFSTSLIQTGSSGSTYIIHHPHSHAIIVHQCILYWCVIYSRAITLRACITPTCSHGHIAFAAYVCAFHASFDTCTWQWILLVLVLSTEYESCCDLKPPVFGQPKITKRESYKRKIISRWNKRGWAEKETETERGTQLRL